MSENSQYVRCPNCDAVWEADEVDNQICEICNYPDHEEWEKFKKESEGNNE